MVKNKRPNRAICMQKSATRAKALGFTLIELSIVLAIIGVVLAGGLSIFGDRLAAERIKETNRRLDLIENAMLLYRRTSGVLPCPAQGDLLSSNSSFGAENCAAAQSGIHYSGTTSAGLCESTGCVRIGVVPTRTLNLPDSMMFDAYGNKITYAVDRTCATSRTWLSDCASLPSQLVIQDANGTARTATTGNTASIYAILSHGPDMVGAWGGKLSTRITVANAAPGTTYGSTLEATNVHDGSTFDNVFRDMLRQETNNAATNFDDFVRWKVKNQL
jgi:prepilin-type N-terminal cleavage/methylation domain-containing protein